MPAIVFDFEEINKNLMGDDWYAPKREMPREIFGPFKPQECEQAKACGPNPHANPPCTTSPTPPLPSGQPGAMPMKAVFDDPRSAVTQLVRVIDDNILQETRKVQEKVGKWREAIEQCRTRRDRIHYENAIEDAMAQYHLVIAPMKRQKDWLIQQLVQLMPRDPPVCVAPVDYECEPVAEIDMRTHKRK